MIYATPPTRLGSPQRPTHIAGLQRIKQHRSPHRTAHIQHGLLATLGVVSTAQIVHEFGHLFRAKRVGANVEYVSIGLGPILSAFDDADGTIYLLHAFPLGCRVIFADDFENLSGLDRAEVHLAGPVANLIFAACMSLAFLATHDHLIMDNGATVSAVITGGAVAKAGVLEGDIVTKVNGLTIEPNELSYAMAAQEMVQAPEVDVEFVRNGKRCISRLEPTAGRLGWKLKPAFHTEEIMTLQEIPRLVGEDLKLSIDSIVGTVRDFVTQSTSERPIRPSFSGSHVPQVTIFR